MNALVRTAMTAAIACLSFALLLMHSVVAGAQTVPARNEPTSSPVPAWLKPERWYLQVGIGEHVDSANVGVVWQIDRGWTLGGARLTVSTEISVGRWHVKDQGGSASGTNTQLGITPALRLTSSGTLGLFGELGVGFNLITPIYRTHDKRFSTAFNFGDHIGVGVRPWGSKGSEIALRIQHFSNAGIKHPNPGENFLQLRWSRSF